MDDGQYVWQTDDEPVPAPDWVPRVVKAADAKPTQIASDAEVEVAKAALAQGENKLDRPDWLRSAFGLKGHFGDVMRLAFIEFSMRWSGGTSTLKEAERVWDTANPDGSVGLGTVLHLLGKSSPDPKFPALGFIQPYDFAAIPKTQFVYGYFYARGYISLTIAAPKVGKSQLSLAEAVDMASGGKVFGISIPKRRVAYLNAEDDQIVLYARVAAICIMHGIDIAELTDTLVLQSCVEWPDLYLIGPDGKGHAINEAAFEHLERFARDLSLDILILDPLQDLSHADETNEAFRALGQRIRLFASTHGISVGLVHHTRKVTPGLTPSIDDARGGSALRGISRFNRVLVAMSENEALTAGIADARYYFRIGDIESNLAPPSSAKNQWFQKVGVDLPNGQNVGAVAKWKWPDQFENITLDMAVRARDELTQLEPIKARYYDQAPDWFGYVVARICGLNFPDDRKSREAKHLKKRVRGILNQWETNSWIRCGETYNKPKSKDVKVYEVGPKNPTEE